MPTGTRVDHTAKISIGEHRRTTLAIFAGSAIPAGCGRFSVFRLNRRPRLADLLSVKKGVPRAEGIAIVNRLIAWLSILFRSPIFWGGLVTALYFGGIEAGVVRNPFLLRFTAGHFVEYVVTAVFFVGSAALAPQGTRSSLSAEAACRIVARPDAVWRPSR